MVMVYDYDSVGSSGTRADCKRGALRRSQCPVPSASQVSARCSRRSCRRRSARRGGDGPTEHRAAGAGRAQRVRSAQTAEQEMQRRSKEKREPE